ncbi:hypothetical protein [Haloarchaeobius amylolyticus]|uniref:hypothetical protein n=1 Tax=Haloarchaeobius amylolyticus TaxID=1198296 RepID=UPI00226EC91E|nr:hypothetical protein [Haloarchaeobius amylolyticus]
MPTFEGTFEIQDRTDAQAVRTLMEEAYNAFREELQVHGRMTEESSEVLQEFEVIRDATRRPAAGRLTIVYERQDEPLDD